ncbi:YwqG family protein [Actinomadura gamaensis]|uniref:YwqG family protein n=1 Tax=Actinomadura gamaensis TaxID=1763541 RepID=A0ABV9U0N9_9ACTN
MHAAGPDDRVVGRLGGEPRLPPDTRWPSCDGHGPLSFVASLDCARLPGTGLPEGGELLFFYFDGQLDDYASFVSAADPQTRAASRVLYVPEGVETAPRPAPQPLEPFRQVSLRAEPAVPPLRITDPEVWESLGIPPDGLDELEAFKYVLIDNDEPGHQVAGRPWIVQHEPAYEIAWSVLGTSDYGDPRLEREAARWELLAQFASDDDAGMTWGDGGTLFWLITPDDLAASRFDRARFTWQSH